MYCPICDKGNSCSVFVLLKVTHVLSLLVLQLRYLMYSPNCDKGNSCTVLVCAKITHVLSFLCEGNFNTDIFVVRLTQILLLLL